MDQPPQTPSRPAGAEPQSTPLSKGSGSNADYVSSNKQGEYAPFLKEDIAQEVTITVAQFLFWILNVPENWITTTASTRKTVAQKVYRECETWETLGDFGDKLYKHKKQLVIYLGSHPRPLRCHYH
jgi:hypothetical protein